MRPKAVWLLLALAVIALLGIVVASGGGSSDDGNGGSAAKSAKRSAAAGTAEVPKPRKVSGPHGDPVPILMYHVVTDPPASATYTDLYVSASNFRQQIDGLAQRGYHGVTLGQLFDYWDEGYELPSKPIVVSFDDGYESQYRNAAPVLKEHGWPGVLSLEVRNTKKSWGLSSRKIRQLIAAGWEINSHTINHLDVSTLDEAGREREIAGSRRLLQRRFDVPVDFFCYPSGRFNDAAVASVRSAGYRGAITTESGLGRRSEPYTLARIRVNRGQSPQGLLDQVGGAG
jgi:peptidoglycan/xylan/chitin deacetylase (PgdA/CDA1 family)